MDPQAPAAQLEAQEHRLGPFRLARTSRLPKTILATVGATLLTAWLFPALTHQWQDRQKARELAAGLVAEIGKETSQALVTSDFFSAGREPFVVNGRFSQQLFNDLDLDWRNARAQIESQLQAYYSREVLDRWRAYSLLVQKTYFLATPDMYQRPTTIKRLHEHFGDANWRLWNGDLLKVPWVTGTQRIPQIKTYLKVSGALLDEKAALTDAVLHDHPAGFSTRGRDVIDDLLP